MLSSSLPTVLAAVERGLGLGVLPDLLGARRGLVAVSDPVESTAVWLAVHPTSKNDPYVRRLRDHVDQMVARW